MICPNPRCRASKKREQSLKIRILKGVKYYTCVACMYIKVANDK